MRRADYALSGFKDQANPISRSGEASFDSFICCAVSHSVYLDVLNLAYHGTELRWRSDNPDSKAHGYHLDVVRAANDSPAFGWLSMFL